MWFLITRNRPQGTQALINAMRDTGEIPTCAVMVDGPMYPIEWPTHWKIHNSFGHLEMQRGLNALLKMYPNEPFYGILTDTHRPQTPEWATKLRDAAADWDIAICNTTKNRMNPRTGLRRVTTMAIGGDLVRAIGWIWLDRVTHLYGDDAWEDIGYALDCIQYLPDVVILALLKRDGEVPIDSNHHRKWKGQSYMASDAAAFEAWKRDEFPKLIERLKAARC
jgi:hypothetical protein